MVSLGSVCLVGVHGMKATATTAQGHLLSVFMGESLKSYTEKKMEEN